MKPRVIAYLKKATLTIVLGGLCAAVPTWGDARFPTMWRLERHRDVPEADPLELPVQLGVRVVQRSDSCLYVYTIVNRSNDTLTSLQVGYNSLIERCELTGKPPHAAPDTAYSPTGWDCSPVQTKHHRETFALEWKPVPGLEETGGVPPGTSIPGFTVALPKCDTLYERCHFRARLKRIPEMSYIGRLIPEKELDVPSGATGNIVGRVTDERGEAVPYANVILKQTQLGGRTGSDGSYIITKVPVGRYRLEARSMGFAPVEQARVRVTPNTSTAVDFRLTKAPPVEPCVPYTTASTRITVPFPGDAVDTRGARYLDRAERLPPREPGKRLKPQLYVYSNTVRQVSLIYPGIGQDTTRRAFVAIVNRNFSDLEEEHLIRIAEETYPPIEAVLPVAGSRPGREALAKEKRLWWYDTFDGVRLPYAVTMDAVRYYLKLTQTMGNGVETSGIRMKASEFTYYANISKSSAYSRDGRVFSDVYVVEMGLSWSNYCGSLCACSFDLNRTVILRPDGTVLCVFGDQRPMVVVS